MTQNSVADTKSSHSHLHSNDSLNLRREPTKRGSTNRLSAASVSQGRNVLRSLNSKASQELIFPVRKTRIPPPPGTIPGYSSLIQRDFFNRDGPYRKKMEMKQMIGMHPERSTMASRRKNRQKALKTSTAAGNVPVRSPPQVVIFEKDERLSATAGTNLDLAASLGELKTASALKPVVTKKRSGLATTKDQLDSGSGGFFRSRLDPDVERSIMKKIKK